MVNDVDLLLLWANDRYGDGTALKLHTDGVLLEFRAICPEIFSDEDTRPQSQYVQIIIARIGHLTVTPRPNSFPAYNRVYGKESTFMVGEYLNPNGSIPVFYTPWIGDPLFFDFVDNAVQVIEKARIDLCANLGWLITPRAGDIVETNRTS